MRNAPKPRSNVSTIANLKSVKMFKPMLPTRKLYTTTTTILVGPIASPTTFYVHTPILTTLSPFFRAALCPASAFLEATTNTVSLPEASPPVFSYFVQYAYTRSLAHEELETPNPAFFWLVRLWKLAGYLGCEELRNDILGEVGRCADQRNAVFSPNDTRELWEDEGEAALAGLKKLCVDLFIYKKTDSLMMGHEDSWDERFLRELVVRLRSLREGKIEGVPSVVPWRDAKVICQEYHEHKDTESCVKVMDRDDSKNAKAAKTE
ncbi:MAG: hypothetical protein Q9187_004118 [Circinaria calcarea]